MSDVLTLLAAHADFVVTADVLRRWAEAPASSRLVGFRRAMLEDLAADLAGTGTAVTPAALFAAARKVEATVSRDTTTLLEGRDMRFVDGNGSKPPADGKLHRKIGSIHTAD